MAEATRLVAFGKQSLWAFNCPQVVKMDEWRVCCGQWNEVSFWHWPMSFWLVAWQEVIRFFPSAYNKPHSRYGTYYPHFRLNSLTGPDRS